KECRKCTDSFNICAFFLNKYSAACLLIFETISNLLKAENQHNYPHPREMLLKQNLEVLYFLTLN
ncbi:MAG: hypothetical protein KDB99_14460, partial [Chitinophagaceae bacterium]|nr:hypothetical protein [Chitinophagaceae bacterium]